MFSFFSFVKNWFVCPKGASPNSPLCMNTPLTARAWRTRGIRSYFRAPGTTETWPPTSELAQIRPVDPWSQMPRYRELQKSRRLAISAARQGRAEKGHGMGRHGRAGHGRAGQGKAEQSRAGMAGQSRAGQSREEQAGPCSAGQGRSMGLEDRAGKRRARQGRVRARDDMVWEGRARQGKTWLGKDTTQQGMGG